MYGRYDYNYNYYQSAIKRHSNCYVSYVGEKPLLGEYISIMCSCTTIPRDVEPVKELGGHALQAISVLKGIRLLNLCGTIGYCFTRGPVTL